MELDNKSKLMKAYVDALPIGKRKGGARPNAGRKHIDEPAKQRCIRFTDEHWQKLKELGGAKWVIERMNEVKGLL